LFENGDLVVGTREKQRREQARRASSNDDDVHD